MRVNPDTTHIEQQVVISSSNNSTANLASSATFTGTGESTLGVAGIQINFIADQPCTLYLDQSMDNTNWDITDSWTRNAGQGSGRTFQAVASYFRMRVTNTGTATTTYLRLQVALCPVVEVVPRALSATGRLKVEAAQTVTGTSTELSYVTTSDAPYKSMMWKPVLSWDVPLGYQYNPYQIQYSAGNSTSYTRATKRLLMGSFDNTTQTFTDGSYYSTPDYGAYLNIYFTADVGTSRTLTITYVNQSGTTGRTATYALTSGSGGDKTGHMQRITLQSGDTGVRDITNMTTSGTGTAKFEVYGETDIFSDSADASGVVYTDTLPLGAFVIPYGFKVSIQVTSASTSAVERMTNLYGILDLV